MTKNRTDKSAAEAYERIAQLALEHALVYETGGGTIVVVHPATQLKQGLYDMCQYMAGKAPHPARNRGDGSLTLSDQAVYIGRQLARELFSKRSNKDEATLTKAELVRLFTLAGERALATAQGTPALPVSRERLIERLEMWVCHFASETGASESDARQEISLDLKDTIAALRTPCEVKGDTTTHLPGCSPELGIRKSVPEESRMSHGNRQKDHCPSSGPTAAPEPLVAPGTRPTDHTAAADGAAPSEKKISASRSACDE